MVALINLLFLHVHTIRRQHTSKTFSPGHMYDVKAGTEERELHPLDSQASPMREKEREALEESVIVPPPTPSRSVITTEGGWGLMYPQWGW